MANFNYSKPFPATVPNSTAVFKRSFLHRPWVDSQDIVQAAETPEEEGFNSRLHKIENDLDALSADSVKAFALIADMRQTLAQCLIEIRDQLNAKTDKPSKEGKEGKESKDTKEAKDAKDGKETKETKDGKETKETKEHKDGKETKEGKERKDGKELSAIEQQVPAPFQMPGAFIEPFQPNVSASEWDLPLGVAFIRPEERPGVGEKLYEDGHA
jgi:hypothetical protein